MYNLSNVMEKEGMGGIERNGGKEGRKEGKGRMERKRGRERKGKEGMK